jgi:hypothetical protein
VSAGRPTKILAVGVVTFGWVAVLAACSTSAKLVGNGGECFQAVDCEQGLVCAPQKNGSRICTGDLTGVQSTLPAGGDAAADATVDGAPLPDAPVSPDAPPPQDNFVPPQDNFVPPDTNPPVDTGAG